MAVQNTVSSSASSISEGQVASSRSSILLQSAAVLIFGAAMLFAVGFSPMEAAHNAAHDTRHSAAFPCH